MLARLLFAFIFGSLAAAATWMVSGSDWLAVGASMLVWLAAIRATQQPVREPAGLPLPVVAPEASSGGAFVPPSVPALPTPDGYINGKPFYPDGSVDDR